MIVKTEIAGGYVWIEHDDSVGLESRIFTLHTSAPGHPSFSMGWALARSVVKELWILTGGAVAENTTEREAIARYIESSREGGIHSRAVQVFDVLAKHIRDGKHLEKP
jgi:hypothetical protein